MSHGIPLRLFKRGRWLLLVLIGIASPALTAAQESYLLAAGDQLRVTVFGHEDLSAEVEVDGSGEISLPLIRQVKALGLSVEELEESITAALKPDYLKRPRVSVEILSYRPYYIMGEVATPGSYPYVNGLTVINAVAVAGGFTYRARKGRITIVRLNGEDQQELEVSLDTLVQPGDVIEVPERFF